MDKYIKQFTEIFTEEGRRAVKITHHAIGQKPTVTYTQTQHMTSTVTSAQNSISSAQAQNIITQATNLAASLAGQASVQVTPVLGVDPSYQTSDYWYLSNSTYRLTGKFHHHIASVNRQSIIPDGSGR